MLWIRQLFLIGRSLLVFITQVRVAAKRWISFQWDSLNFQCWKRKLPFPQSLIIRRNNFECRKKKLITQFYDEMSTVALNKKQPQIGKNQTPTEWIKSTIRKYLESLINSWNDYRHQSLFPVGTFQVWIYTFTFSNSFLVELTMDWNWSRLWRRHQSLPS